MYWKPCLFLELHNLHSPFPVSAGLGPSVALRIEQFCTSKGRGFGLCIKIMLNKPNSFPSLSFWPVPCMGRRNKWPLQTVAFPSVSSLSYQDLCSVRNSLNQLNKSSVEAVGRDNLVWEGVSLNLIIATVLSLILQLVRKCDGRFLIKTLNIDLIACCLRMQNQFTLQYSHTWNPSLSQLDCCSQSFRL